MPYQHQHTQAPTFNECKLLVNPPCRNETLKKIHASFLVSIYSATSDLDFLRKLLDNLQSQIVAEEDITLWEIFVDGVRNCLRLHEHSTEFIESARYIGTAIEYLVIWLNTKFDQPIKFRIVMRKKAIFSHLMKMLKKSLKCDYMLRNDLEFIQDLSSCIHDFIGGLGIILDSYDKTVHPYHPQLKRVSQTIRNILSGHDSKSKDEFLTWLDGYKCNPITKSIIIEILKIPFMTTRFKNFVDYPKENNYRTIQWTFIEEEYSTVTPGAETEIQIRDAEMHYEALFGKASHFRYKTLDDLSGEFKDPEFKGLDLETLLNVFCIDDFSRVHIDGFTHYEKHPAPISFLDETEVTHDGDPYGFNVPKQVFLATI